MSADIDADDIAEALQSAAFVARKKAAYASNVPVVAGEKAVRLLRMRLKVFLQELPGDMTIEELRALIAPPRTTTDTPDDGDDE